MRVRARAEAAESSLETRLSSEEVNRAADVSSEASRAAAAEDSIELRLSNEEDARVAGDASLTTRVAAEEVARAAGDASLETLLSSETSSRVAADSSLETRLSTEEDRVDDILDSADADKDSFAEIVSLINAVDTTNDNALATAVSSINSDSSK